MVWVAQFWYHSFRDFPGQWTSDAKIVSEVELNRFADRCEKWHIVTSPTSTALTSRASPPSTAPNTDSQPARGDRSSTSLLLSSRLRREWTHRALAADLSQTSGFESSLLEGQTQERLPFCRGFILTYVRDHNEKGYKSDCMQFGSAFQWTSNAQAWMSLLSIISAQIRMGQTSRESQRIFETQYLSGLGEAPKFVRLEGMHQSDGHCDDLIRTTMDALNPGVVALMLLAVQTKNLELSVQLAVKRGLAKVAAEESVTKELVRECLGVFPAFWCANGILRSAIQDDFAAAFFFVANLDADVDFLFDPDFDDDPAFDDVVVALSNSTNRTNFLMIVTIIVLRHVTLLYLNTSIKREDALQQAYGEYLDSDICVKVDQWLTASPVCTEQQIVDFILGSHFFREGGVCFSSSRSPSILSVTSDVRVGSGLKARGRVGLGRARAHKYPEPDPIGGSGRAWVGLGPKPGLTLRFLPHRFLNPIELRRLAPAPLHTDAIKENSPENGGPDYSTTLVTDGSVKILSFKAPRITCRNPRVHMMGAKRGPGHTMLSILRQEGV
ncbi:hypothetical protein B0H10DRAFT_1966321 [Mycena sp. CBHHK59/15]|nr:hypothetical protein B0H10DRAFT_1966321 [Mycena sp. CBHHK59/15]